MITSGFVTAVPQVPEPSTFVLTPSVLLLGGWLVRRRSQGL